MAIFTPTAFIANTTIKSADVNANFTSLASILNGTNQIPRNVLATGTANAVVANDGSGFLGEGIAPSTSGNVLTSNGTNWVSSAAATAPIQPYEIYNVGLAASVGSSALTVALKQSDGATNATAGSSTKIAFRDVTVSSGAVFERAITGALSIVVPATATLGSVSGVDFYVYVYAIDNAGTVELAVSGTKYDGSAVRSTTTIAAASNTLATIYSATGRSSVPVRLIGRLLVNEATAGTWASVPSEILLAPSLIATNRKVPTVQTFTSGSGTYTTPPSVAHIRVLMVGGGGGGGGSGGSGGTGGTGGNTTFGTTLLVANGGVGGLGGANFGGAGGSASLGSGPLGLALSGGTGQGGGGIASAGMIGGQGGSSALGGAGAGAPAASNTGGSAPANSGSGGGGAGSAPGQNAGAGGGAGGYVYALITNPDPTYAYAVGTAGTAGTAGTSGSAGGAGGSGIIIVEEYYN